jgi:dTDP-4-dehydrorhamnose 3,5-epimerase
MLFKETKINGVFVIEPELIKDERGFFACSWSQSEFEQHGLNPRLIQCNISFNNKRGTVRGMHFQEKPYEEAKLVRCTRGAMFDVAVDLRSDSPTRFQWAGVELTADNRLMFYIPEGFAHGYQTLVDDTEISYQMSQSYHSEAARGLRWDDPVLGIEWPQEVTVISERDKAFQLLEKDLSVAAPRKPVA